MTSRPRSALIRSAVISSLYKEMKAMQIKLGLWLLAGFLVCPTVNAAVDNMDQIMRNLPVGVEDALRDIAKHVEAEQREKNPAAQGLWTRVDELLRRKSPAPREGFLALARLPSGSVEVKPGMSSTSGLVFCGTESAVQAEVLELETQLQQASDPLPLRVRMAGLARHFLDAAQADRLTKAALVLAQERADQHPEKADAHAWLAECLRLLQQAGEADGMKEAERALELDTKCWRAMLVLAQVETGRIQQELLPGAGRALEQPGPPEESFLRALHDNPPDDARIASLEKRAAAARTWFERASTAAPHEVEVRLRVLAGMRFFPDKKVRSYARLAHEMRNAPLEQFVAAAQQAEAEKTYLAMNEPWDEMLEISAFRPMDPHLLAAAVMYHSMPRLMQLGADDQPPPEVKSLVLNTLEKLQKMGNLPDKSVAAKACEAYAVLGFLMSGLLDPAKHQVPEMALRSVQLDPHRHVAWVVLFGSLATGGREQAVCAAAEIRLALWPFARWHHDYAAAARLLDDWKSCRDHLQISLASTPDDVAIKAELAGVVLCESAGQKLPESLHASFAELRELYSTKGVSLKTEVIEKIVVNLIIYTCLQKQWDHARAIILHSRDTGKIAAETADKLLALMPK